jgi:hypothetical protein
MGDSIAPHGFDRQSEITTDWTDVAGARLHLVPITQTGKQAS